MVGTAKFAHDKKEYDYSIELDAAGRIIGGQYYLKSNQDRPDFLWNAPKLQFGGYYEGINRIYRPSAVQNQRSAAGSVNPTWVPCPSRPWILIPPP